MATIASIQHRDEYTGSSKGYSDYDNYVISKSFNVSKTFKDLIKLYFPTHTSESEGVGLVIPKEIAIAVGRALITVGEGTINVVKGEFE